MDIIVIELAKVSAREILHLVSGLLLTRVLKSVFLDGVWILHFGEVFSRAFDFHLS